MKKTNKNQTFKNNSFERKMYMSIKNTLKSIFFKTDKGNAIMPESDVNQVFLAGTVVYK